MALNKREQILLVSVIAILFIGGNWILLAPAVRDWHSINTQLKNKQREFQSMKGIVEKEQPKWKLEYEELSASLQSRERFDQTSDVLKKIEEVAANVGISFSTRKPLPVVEKEVYRELPVQCTFEATVESLVKFLHSLQTSSGFMSVESLQVTPRADNPSILRGDIQVRALAGKSERGKS
jgi:Tfp pilus assembly protein PilO